MDAPEELVSWRHSASIQEEWVSFVETWAARLDARYGHLTDDASHSRETALEMATQVMGIDPPTVPRCHEALRGYSWVTVCAPELAQRLGGVPALTAPARSTRRVSYPAARCCCAPPRCWISTKAVPQDGSSGCSLRCSCLAGPTRNVRRSAGVWYSALMRADYQR
jgi:hypothetical protein